MLDKLLRIWLFDERWGAKVNLHKEWNFNKKEATNRKATVDLSAI